MAHTAAQMLRQIYKMQQSQKSQGLLAPAYLSAHKIPKVDHRRLREHPQAKPLQFSLPHRRSSIREVAEMSSLNQTIDTSKELSESGNKPEEIYFSKVKKYNYMKQIIDKYFQEGKRERHIASVILNNPEDQKQPVSAVPKLSKLVESREHQAPRGRRILGHLARRSLKESSEELGESMAGSRLLGDSADELKEIDVTRSLSFTHKNSCSLPPIHEILEDKDEEEAKFESISYLNQSVSQFSVVAPSSQQNRTRIMSNEVYTVEVVATDGRATHKLKTYTEKGMPILARQLKAQALGVEPYWLEYKYDTRCMISPPGPSLRELLFRARKMDAESKFLTLRPKKYYKKLLANNCEELRRVIIDLCEQLRKIEGKLVNNKLNTANLFIGKNENLRLGEWGFGSFRETHLIQGIDFENRLDPIFKSQQQWFIPPEYMAPELLRAVALSEESDLASLGSAPDVWSLGVCIFEIVTLIPVWMVEKCTVAGKEMVARSGVLAVGGRDVRRMLKRQEKLAWLMRKIMKQQWPEGDDRVIELISRCVDYNPENRPTFCEIIQMLR